MFRVIKNTGQRKGGRARVLLNTALSDDVRMPLSWYTTDVVRISLSYYQGGPWESPRRTGPWGYMWQDNAFCSSCGNLTEDISAVGRICAELVRGYRRGEGIRFCEMGEQRNGSKLCLCVFCYMRLLYQNDSAAKWIPYRVRSINKKILFSVFKNKLRISISKLAFLFLNYKPMRR